MAKYENYTGKLGDISAEDIDLRLKQIAAITEEEADLTGKKPERFERLMELQEQWGEVLLETDIPDELAGDDEEGGKSDDGQNSGTASSDKDAATTVTKEQETPPKPETTPVPKGKKRVVASKTFQVFDKDSDGKQFPVFCSKGKHADLHPDVAKQVIQAKAGTAA